MYTVYWTLWVVWCIRKYGISRICKIPGIHTGEISSADERHWTNMLWVWQSVVSCQCQTECDMWAAAIWHRCAEIFGNFFYLQHILQSSHTSYRCMACSIATSDWYNFPSILIFILGRSIYSFARDVFKITKAISVNCTPRHTLNFLCWSLLTGMGDRDWRPFIYGGNVNNFAQWTHHVLCRVIHDFIDFQYFCFHGIV